MKNLYNDPFVWGTTDCISAAANYIQRHTGVDYMSEYRGKYTTAYGAYRLLAKEGGMEAALEKRGFTKVEANRQMTGDIALYYAPKQGLTMGIVDRSVAVFAGGIVRQLSEVKAFYRVPQTKKD